MKRIKLNYHNLHTLKDANPKVRKAIISNCDKDLINSVSECALNVLRGNITLSNCKKGRLRKFKRQLRAVVDKRVPVTIKKRLIIQRGGFLVPLLTAVLPALATFIFDKLKSS